MVILKKDGSVYKLKSPNPIMQEQDLWEKYIVHNMNLGEKSFEEKNVTLKEIVAPQIVNLEPTNKIVVEDKPKPQPKIKTTNMYLLPAVSRQIKDELYGDVKTKIEYQDQLLIETVILELTDRKLSFWTRIDIAQNSIVYPQTQDKRWWKIITKQEKTGGWQYETIFSEYQPSFG